MIVSDHGMTDVREPGTKYIDLEKFAASIKHQVSYGATMMLVPEDGMLDKVQIYFSHFPFLIYLLQRLLLPHYTYLNLDHIVCATFFFLSDKTFKNYMYLKMKCKVPKNNTTNTAY